MLGTTFTDAAIAEAVSKELDERFIYVPGIGWHAWDGQRWAGVDEDVPLAFVMEWTKARARQAAAAFNDGTGTSERLREWLKREDGRRITMSVRLARTLVGVAPEHLDRNPDLLNCRNGTVHLPTGELLAHNPRHYITKVAGCDYLPTALHEDWNAALAAIPPAVAGWLQVRYGQACTGYMSPDDKVIIQQGGGANGKSTILAGVAAALGDYYWQASDKILMAGRADAHTTDFADLRGARFVTIEETPEAGRLDVVRLKKLAGTERITARRMNKDNMSFPATHTLFVNTNYPPVVAETDEGTWRRLLLVNFPYTFSSDPVGENERHGDPGLRERLRAGVAGQHEAVLGWLIEGAAAWYAAAREMPGVPESVEAETEAWRGRTDHVGAFWADHLDPDPNSYIYAGDLIWMFNNYLRQHGNAPVAESTFVRRFATHAVTTGSLVRKERVRQNQRGLKQSRPYGALDPFSRLPGVPAGQVSAWTGVRFRASTETLEAEESWDHTKGRDL